MVPSPTFLLLFQNYSNIRLGILPLQADLSEGPPGPWLPMAGWWKVLSRTAHATSPEVCVWCESLAWGQNPTFCATPSSPVVSAELVWMVFSQLLKSEYPDSFTYFLLQPCQRNEDFHFYTLLRETSLSKSEYFWSCYCC